MKRRHLLAAAPALLATPWSRADAVPAAPGELVQWPTGAALLDGTPWQPAPGVAQIVVIWSTTCPYCRRHNQRIEQLHRALGHRAAAVLGVARESDGAAVQRYVAEQGYTFPVTLAWREMAAALTTRRVIPLTVTVDRQGRLRQVIPGEMSELDVMALVSMAD